jgi:outer membrane receptor protein involved in Fe transport
MVALMLLAVANGWTQETTGDVRGTVRSQDGLGLPGVTVTLKSADTGLSRVDVSGADGVYRFAALPPGPYVLESTLDGFQSQRLDLGVRVGATTTADLTMQLGAVTEVIDVSADVPLIDVASTVGGLTVSTTKLNDRLPVTQDTQRIALLAPATTPGDSAFDGAGDGTYDQKLVSVGGASVAENSYQVNGLNLTNFRTGLGSSWVPMQFVEEVQVKTGGYEAEYGRSTGGVVNMVTKSGTNQLRGAFTAFFEPESLQDQEPDTFKAYNSLEERELLELNASLGGPLVRDRLFAFGFVQYRDTEYLKNSLTRANRETTDSPYWGGKLDWNMTASHRLEGTYLTDETEVTTQPYEIVDGVIGNEPLPRGWYDRGGDNYSIKYSGILSDNFLLAAQYGYNGFDRTDRSEGDDCPIAIDYTGAGGRHIGCYVNTYRGYRQDERTAYRLDADWFVGDHSLRAGVDAEENNSLDDTSYSGGRAALYFLNEGAYPELPDDQMLVQEWIYTAEGSFDVNSTAAYVQDSWSLTPDLTLNLGLRWEQYENFNIDGEAFIKIDDQFAPRLGAIWDPSGAGRTKLFGSVGLYHLPIASNTNIRLAGAEFFTIGWYTADGWNPDGSPVNQGSEPLDPLIYYSDGVPIPVESAADANIEPMAQWEYIVGYEQMVGDTWSLGARFVHRDFDTVIEDIGADYALYNVYGIDLGAWWGPLANPGSDLTVSYDADGDGVLEDYYFTADQLEYPEPVRRYYALELTARRRFSDNWMLDASYTWSRSYGNYEGYVDSTIEQSDGGITQLFDYPGLMDHSYGNLPNDRRHNLKVFGAYSWEWGLQVGANAYYFSGRPISGLGVHPTDPWAASYETASFYVQGQPAPRGSFGRTDDVWGLDTMLKYDFRVGGADLNVRLDVFNLFGNDSVSEVDEDGDHDNGNPNPTFMLPEKYQSPRTVRIGFGLSF